MPEIKASANRQAILRRANCLAGRAKHGSLLSFVGYVFQLVQCVLLCSSGIAPPGRQKSPSRGLSPSGSGGSSDPGRAKFQRSSSFSRSRLSGFPLRGLLSGIRFPTCPFHDKHGHPGHFVLAGLRRLVLASHPCDAVFCLFWKTRLHGRNVTAAACPAGRRSRGRGGTRPGHPRRWPLRPSPR